MRDNDTIRTPPTLHFAGLKIWIHGRAYPEATDYWDGNWLLVTATCTAPGSHVSVSGSFLHLSELVQWFDACAQLSQNRSGEAHLVCIEPTLGVQVTGNRAGHLTVAVSLTPDHLMQAHHVQFELDQSYLPALLAAGRDVVRAYPIRSSQSV